MKKYIYKILSLLLFISFSNCDDFLEELPTKEGGIPITKVEHLEAILNNYPQFASQELDDVIFGTDDYELNTNLFDNDLQNAPDLTLNAVLDTDFIQELGSDKRYWKDPWEKIYKANLILHFADKVEGDAVLKEELKKEARFIRAYTYLKLVSVYCLPYSEQNKSELGLPIKKEINFEESLVRASLEETYNFIEEDIKEALKLNKGIATVSTSSLNEIWRASTVAINGFAARFYLIKHDYVNAQKYADIALGINSSLVNYNTDIKYITEEETIYTPTKQKVTVTLPSTYEDDQLPFITSWAGLYFYRILFSNIGRGYWPSQALLNTYDKVHDLRYQYHIVEGFSYVKGARGNSRGKLAFNYPGYVFFGSSKIASGPSTPEMLLIKAESQIRQGQWQQGITTANILRVKRIANTAPANVINLSAANKQDALTKILEERRRELAFVSRWDDIRRYNNNEDTSDDVTINRTFYGYNSSNILTGITQNYTIPPKSRKYARPIPTEEVLGSQNKLVQNRY